MRLTERFRRGVAIVAIKGDLLDEQDEAVLQQEIHSLATDGIRKVVVDLSTLNLINHRGFSALLVAFATLRRLGGDLRIACTDLGARNLFSMTKIVSTFHTYETVDRALASFVR